MSVLTVQIKKNVISFLRLTIQLLKKLKCNTYFLVKIMKYLNDYF